MQGVRGRGGARGKSCTLDKVADAAGCCCLLFLPNIRHAVHVAVQHIHTPPVSTLPSPLTPTPSPTYTWRKFTVIVALFVVS